MCHAPLSVSSFRSPQQCKLTTEPSLTILITTVHSLPWQVNTKWLLGRLIMLQYKLRKIICKHNMSIRCTTRCAQCRYYKRMNVEDRSWWVNVVFVYLRSGQNNWKHLYGCVGPIKRQVKTTGASERENYEICLTLEKHIKKECLNGHLKQQESFQQANVCVLFYNRLDK